MRRENWNDIVEKEMDNIKSKERLVVRLTMYFIKLVFMLVPHSAWWWRLFNVQFCVFDMIFLVEVNLNDSE